MITVQKAKYIEGYKIKVEFSDGNSHIVDFIDFKMKSGLFDQLKDIDNFRQFEVDEELGTIRWKNGLDISPESLFARATGILPNWAV
jgi:hypothetical protein